MTKTATKTAPKTKRTKTTIAESTGKNIVAIKKPDSISDQIEVLRKDLALLAETVKTQGKARIATTKDSVKESVKSGADSVSQTYSEYAGQAEQTIRSKPLTSVAVAAGIGALIGLLARR